MIDTFTYNVEVTSDIATKIRQFAEMGVFSMKGGSCEIHFDAEGNVSQVVTHTHQRVIHNQKVSEVAMKDDIVIV